MVRLFDKNIFIMLLSIMIGAVVITYFVADLQFSSDKEVLITQHTATISGIKEKNIDFTTYFIKSLGLLDMARVDRATGNYHFDLAFMWYTSALSETNNTKMELYKARIIDNCTNAMEKYDLSHDNFATANSFFNDTIAHIQYESYSDLLNLYVNLTDSGMQLTLLRNDASMYLKYLAENLTFVGGEVLFSTNVSEILELFNTTQDLYGAMAQEYIEIEGQIEKEYDIEGFSEER